MKPVVFIGSAREDLLDFPPDVVREFGYALYLAQSGGKHPTAKPLKGFGGAGVLEMVEDHAGDAYRCVYTVHFAEVVYVLHAFQKKATRGIATPDQHLEKVRQRLRMAYQEHERWRHGTQ